MKYLGKTNSNPSFRHYTFNNIIHLILTSFTIRCCITVLFPENSTDDINISYIAPHPPEIKHSIKQSYYLYSSSSMILEITYCNLALTLVYKSTKIMCAPWLESSPVVVTKCRL